MRTLLPILVIVSILSPPAGLAGTNRATGFYTPDIGNVASIVVSPFHDPYTGFLFTALPRGAVEGETGLVNSEQSSVCLGFHDSQMLGTATAGSGNIGHESFPLYVDFTTVTATPTRIAFTVQTVKDASIMVVLYDVNGDPVTPVAYYVTTVYVSPCASTGLSKFVQLGFVTNIPLASMLIDTGEGAPFIIDEFGCDTIVSVQSTTWGRVKALYSTGH